MIGFFVVKLKKVQKKYLYINIHIIKKRDCQRQSLLIHSSKTDQSPGPLLMYPLALTVRSYPSYRQVSWLGTQTYYLPFPPRRAVVHRVRPSIQ